MFHLKQYLKDVLNHGVAQKGAAAITSPDVKNDATPINSDADAINDSGVRNAFDNFWKIPLYFLSSYLPPDKQKDLLSWNIQPESLYFQDRRSCLLRVTILPAFDPKNMHSQIGRFLFWYVIIKGLTYEIFNFFNYLFQLWLPGQQPRIQALHNAKLNLFLIKNTSCQKFSDA